MLRLFVSLLKTTMLCQIIYLMTYHNEKENIIETIDFKHEMDVLPYFENSFTMVSDRETNHIPCFN